MIASSLLRLIRNYYNALRNSSNNQKQLRPSIALIACDVGRSNLPFGVGVKTYEAQQKTSAANTEREADA
jgi:hypothetical protein